MPRPSAPVAGRWPARPGAVRRRSGLGVERALDRVRVEEPELAQGVAEAHLALVLERQGAAELVAVDGPLAHQELAEEHAVEAVEPIEMPLDVLAQVILSIVAHEPWTIDDLHDLLRTSWPYRNLERRQLDLVLDMHAGRYADARVRRIAGGSSEIMKLIIARAL